MMAGAAQPFLLQAQAEDPWSEVPSILARIKPPKFPSRDFHVMPSSDTDAISKAIAMCSQSGGGAW